MYLAPTKRLCAAFAMLLVVASVADAWAATRTENFNSATGSPNDFTSPSGMVFTASGGSFIFSTQFNPFYAPYISGKTPMTGCTGCFAPTMRIAWPSGQRSLVFGWGTQGYTAVRVTAFRNGQQVWQQNQSGTAGSGLYKQQFSRTAANAGEYFDQVAVTWPGGGTQGTGYGVLFDNVTSIDAYAALVLAGDNQNTPVSHPFAAPLSVVVRDYQDHPVANVAVDFMAPPSRDTEPTVIFAATGETFDTAITDANGLAVSSAITANALEGAVDVNLSTMPPTGIATFHLNNLSADTLFANGFE